MTTRGRVLSLTLALAVPAVLAGADDVSKGSGVSKDSGGSSGGSSSSSSSSGSSSSDSGSSSGGSSNSGGGERAVPRDSGGSHESGARRPSSEGASSSSAGRNRGGYSKGDSGYGKSGAETTDAERRHPRPGAPHGEYGDRDGRTTYYGGRRVIYGHYGGHYHGTIYYPHTCYYDYWDYPHYRNRYYSYDPTGAVRVLVDPPSTKVYVDGYYAGIADDFDGVFQRLYLPPGRHEIALKLEGFRTHRVQIYSARGHTIKLHHNMASGEGEDEPEDMAGPLREEEEEEMRARESDERDPARRSGNGTLRLEVRPKDASIYVDGEFWGNGVEEPLRLPAGRHEIAVVRPGFHSIEREVDIRSGESFDLEIDLRRASKD